MEADIDASNKSCATFDIGSSPQYPLHITYPYTASATAEIDVMIVPGVAFTHEGARCGRGKGFYDKHLSHNSFRAYTVGVCYPYQVVAELPTEEHDRRLDRVVTAQRL